MPSGNFSADLSCEALILSPCIVFCLITSSGEEYRSETKEGSAKRQIWATSEPRVQPVPVEVLIPAPGCS